MRTRVPKFSLVATALLASVALLLPVLFATSPMPVQHAHGGATHAHAFGGFHHGHQHDDQGSHAPTTDVPVERHRAEHTRLDADAILARMVPVGDTSADTSEPAASKESSEPVVPADEPARFPEPLDPAPDSGYFCFATPVQDFAPAPLVIEAALAPTLAWNVTPVFVATEQYSCSAPRGPPALG